MAVTGWQEQGRRMLTQAVLAPSSHNTQPWRFQLSETGIELWADRTRRLPVNDPLDRELLISCGCALLNLRLGAAELGLNYKITLFPAPDNADLLARLEVEDGGQAPEEERVLAPWGKRRHTVRGSFTGQPVAVEVIQRLRQAARHEGVELVSLEADAKEAVTKLVAAGDLSLWANADWRRELATWVRSTGEGQGLAVPSMLVPLVRWSIARLDLGRWAAAASRKALEGTSVVLLLTTEGDSPGHWLNAGQALQRTLLVACRAGLQAAFLNQAIQVPYLRAELGELVGGGSPQILLHLGYPKGTVSAAPRRPLEEVAESSHLTTPVPEGDGRRN